ncbi:hypothetical protein KY285_023694 [Solanum tuberosum]|nr:hypothetical protein KY285_023694 [Solanum tuberosum]
MKLVSSYLQQRQVEYQLGFPLILNVSNIFVCFFDEDSHALPCLELEGFSDVMFSHLKEVKLQGFLAQRS